MGNNKNNFQTDESGETSRNKRQIENSGFEVSNQGQDLGGGKTESTGAQNPANSQKLSSDDDNFGTQVDQTTAQAAPGQTATNTNQGGSNA